MDEIQVLLLSQDSPHLLAATDLAFREYGYRVESVSSTKEAVQTLMKGQMDFVLIDLFLSPTERAGFLKRVQALSPMATIMIFAGDEDAGLVLDNESLFGDYSFGFVDFQEDRTLPCGS